MKEYRVMWYLKNKDMSEGWYRAGINLRFRTFTEKKIAEEEMEHIKTYFREENRKHPDKEWTGMYANAKYKIMEREVSDWRDSK